MWTFPQVQTTVVPISLSTQERHFPDHKEFPCSTSFLIPSPAWEAQILKPQTPGLETAQEGRVVGIGAYSFKHCGVNQPASSGRAGTI